MTSLVKKAWIPLLIVVVVVIAGFTVHRIRTFFGSEGIIVTPVQFADDPEPFDPKVVKYEIFGEPGAYADINYLDLDAKPQRVDGASLPWSLTLSTTAAASLNHPVFDAHPLWREGRAHHAEEIRRICEGQGCSSGR